jgi:RNA polymerase sigma factor (sigma-70 family)
MTDENLIQLIRTGNSGAYRALVERYQDLVFTLCSRVLNDSFEAEEAAQETFIKAYQALNRFRGQCKFSTWLYRIAYNTAISRTRKKKNTYKLNEATYEVENTEEAFHGLDALASSERKEYLHLALQQLGPEDCLLVSLYFLEEKDLDELAKISGMEKGTVKVRIHRAKKKLYQHLCHLVKGEAKEQL